jgi:hypothetical protein
MVLKDKEDSPNSCLWVVNTQQPGGVYALRFRTAEDHATFLRIFGEVKPQPTLVAQ